MGSALPPIVEAKLEVPVPHAPVPLLGAVAARLEGGLDRAGTVVVGAPPGFGRRDLVGLWCRRQPPWSVAWMRTDPGDGPVRFLLHLAAALARVDPSLGVGVRDPAERGRDAVLDEGLPALLEQVHRLGRRVTLVLDDVHDLPAASRDGLARCLLDRPPNLRLVLVTADRDLLDRWPPHAGMPPLVLGPADLVLGPEDVEALAEAYGVEVTRSRATALVEATAGWPAGCNLALRAARRTGAPPAWDPAERRVAEFAHRVACRSLDDADRRVLTAIAPAGVVDVALATRLSGVVDAIGPMRRLHTRFLLADGPDGTMRVPGWVRHHVTVERSLEDPEALTRTRATAARHLADRGLVDATLDLVAAEPDAAPLVDLLLAHHHAWSAGPHAERILGIVDRCLAAAPSRVELYLVKAWAEALSQRSRASAATLALVEALPVPDDLADLVAGEAAAVRCNLARLEGRLDDALAEARRMVAAADRVPTGMPSAYRGLVPGATPILLGVALLGAGELDECRELLLAATARDRWSPVARGTLHGTLALVAWLQDDPVAPIHAAIAASHIGEGASQGDFLGPAALALVGDGEDAERATAWTAAAAPRLRAPLSAVLAELVQAVRAGDDAARIAHLAEARRIAESAPQPGVLHALVARAADAVDGEDGGPRLGDDLTDGERRVVRALGGDLTEREIAEVLHLSHNTVRTYRRRAYRKLGVASRAEAVAALRRLERG